jgi:hypothetical protein
MLTMTETPDVETTDAPADKPDAAKGVDATMGAESAHAARIRGLADRIIKLCQSGRDHNTAMSLEIGSLCEEAIILNCEQHPTIPKNGKGGMVPQTLKIIWERIAAEAPWMGKGGHVTEYRRVYQLAEAIKEDAPGIRRISFDVLRVLASCLNHDESSDTFTVRATIEVSEGKRVDCDYRTYLVNRIAEIAAAPESAKEARDHLRQWEKDQREALMSVKDRKVAERTEKAAKLAAESKARQSFLDSIAVKAAELGISNQAIEETLVAAEIIGERVTLTDSGEVSTADPASMSAEAADEFARDLIRAENDTAIGVMFRAFLAYVQAKNGKPKAAPAPRPQLDDSPRANAA